MTNDTGNKGFNYNAAGDGLSEASAAFAEAAPETTSFGGSTPNHVQQTNSAFDQVFFANQLRRVPQQVEDFVNDVMSLLKQTYPDLSHGIVPEVPNFVYFKRDRIQGTSVIPVVQMVEFADIRYNDERDIGYRQNDAKNAAESIKRLFPKCVCLEPITLLTNSRLDMTNTRQTAEAIRVSMFYKTEEGSALTASVFEGKTLETRYDVQEAKSYLQEVSPHATLPRIETAAVFQTVVNNNNNFSHNARAWSSNNFVNGDSTRPTIVFTVGGYVEIGNPVTRTERGVEVTKFETFYHITAAYSRFNTLGMLAMGLTAFSAHIINDWGWVPQFYNKKANGDLGMTLEDLDNRGNFVKTDGNDEVMDLAQQRFWPPVMIIDSEVGFNLFSGLNSLTSQDQNKVAAVNNYLHGFFNNPKSPISRFNGQITNLAGLTLEGYYGNAQGVLEDTRNFDWFKLAETDGISALRSEQGFLMRSLLNDDMWTMMRFRLMTERLPDVKPLVECRKFVIIPEWLNWVADAMGKFGIKIQDTSRSGSFARNVGSMASEYIRDRVTNPTTSFGSSNVFGDVDIFS